MRTRKDILTNHEAIPWNAGSGRETWHAGTWVSVNPGKFCNTLTLTVSPLLYQYYLLSYNVSPLIQDFGINGSKNAGPFVTCSVSGYHPMVGQYLLPFSHVFLSNTQTRLCSKNQQNFNLTSHGGFWGDTFRPILALLRGDGISLSQKFSSY
jgi:hypothetical protein